MLPGLHCSKGVAPVLHAKCASHRLQMQLLQLLRRATCPLAHLPPALRRRDGGPGQGQQGGAPPVQDSTLQSIQFTCVYLASKVRGGRARQCSCCLACWAEDRLATRVLRRCGMAGCRAHRARPLGQGHCLPSCSAPRAPPPAHRRRWWASRPRRTCCAACSRSSTACRSTAPRPTRCAAAGRRLLAAACWPPPAGRRLQQLGAPAQYLPAGSSPQATLPARLPANTSHTCNTRRWRSSAARAWSGGWAPSSRRTTWRATAARWRSRELGSDWLGGRLAGHLERGGAPAAVAQGAAPEACRQLLLLLLMLQRGSRPAEHYADVAALQQGSGGCWPQAASFCMLRSAAPLAAAACRDLFLHLPALSTTAACIPAAPSGTWRPKQPRNPSGRGAAWSRPG